MILPWYATREDVKLALDYKDSIPTDPRIDRAIDAASRKIDRVLARQFYPFFGTRVFDWPTHQYEIPWKLWLGQNECCALPSTVTISNGTVTVPATDYFMRPDDAFDRGVPFTKMEINLGSQSAFNSGTTHQRAIGITSVFGYTKDTTSVGTLLASTTSGATSVTVSNSGPTGVGSTLVVDSEYMIVTDRSMVVTAGQSIGSLAANAGVTSVPVTAGQGATYSNREVITIDAEDMLITKVIGDTLIVKRGWNGTVLAAHNASTAIYAPRVCTVQRASVGTSAASHNNGAALSAHRPPQAVSELCIAEAATTAIAEMSGYAQSVGEQGATTRLGVGLPKKWDDAMAAYGRQMRIRTAARLI